MLCHLPTMYIEVVMRDVGWISVLSVKRRSGSIPCLVVTPRWDHTPKFSLRYRLLRYVAHEMPNYSVCGQPINMEVVYDICYLLLTPFPHGV